MTTSKRLLSVFLMALLALSMSGLTALAEAPEEDFVEYTANYEGYTLPLADPADNVTINCWGFPLPEWKVDNLEDNQFTQWLQEQTGITINWTMGPSTDRDTKLNLLLSSGDYPEVIFNAPFDASQQQIYGQMGVILPLNDLIDKYGKETQRIFSEVPEIEQALLREGGNIYVMPQYSEDPHGQTFSRLWVYKPWLDAVGLDEPTTTEEFYEMLVAFRDQDPNGNGQQDEIALVGANVLFSEPFTYLMNSFIYLDNQNMMNVDDGTIIPVYAQEEYREGLRYIARLYDEGLIMPQTFSQNEQALRQVLSTEPMIVGSFAAHAPFVYCDEPIYRDMVALSPLVGPEGVQYTCQYYNTSTMGTVITNKCEDPELVFKLMDFIYSTEATTRKSQGPEGVSWEWNEDETLVNAYGVTPTWLTLQNSADQQPNDRWAMLGHNYQPLERSAIYVMDMSPEGVEARENDTGRVDGYVQIQTAAMEKYMDYLPPAEIRLPQVFLFSEDDALTLADLQLAVNNKVWEMRVAFVTGAADLEQDWDKYISDLQALGMDEVVGLYQKAYDEQYK